MARTTRGMVFKRDAKGAHVARKREKGTPGNWYAQYFHQGKRVVHALGEKVHTRKKAEGELTRLLRPYSAANEVDRRR